MNYFIVYLLIFKDHMQFFFNLSTRELSNAQRLLLVVLYGVPRIEPGSACVKQVLYLLYYLSSPIIYNLKGCK